MFIRSPGVNGKSGQLPEERYLISLITCWLFLEARALGPCRKVHSDDQLGRPYMLHVFDLAKVIFMDKTHG